jgi:RNA polymerase sigma-70 factor, ECF subfamily
VSEAGAEIERLYRSHGSLVLRRARTLLGSEPDAQEALQEVFASLLRAPETLRSTRSMVGWLYESTTHFCLNQLRNRRTSARLIEQRIAPAAPLNAGQDARALAEVRSLLAQLPAEVAAALVYTHLDGMTHAEVARQLGCSKRQVGYLLERAQESILAEEQSA